MKFGILNKENTSPFIFGAISYCLILALPFMLFLALKGLPHKSGEIPIDMGNVVWYKNAESRQFVLLTRTAIFSAILSIGALGAAISLISRARNKTLNYNITFKEMLSVQTIGAIFSLILSLMFMGEMIAGTLFPNADAFYYIIYIPAAFAKLIVWSFIAGFFERFVPNLLNNFSKQNIKSDE